MPDDPKKASPSTTLPQHLPFLTLLLLLLLGFYALHGPVRSYLSGRYRAVALVDEAMGIVLEEYVDPRTPQDLSQGAIDGMIDSLRDQHSMFLRPQKNQQMAEDERGRYVGIGIGIRLHKHRVIITDVFEGSPAMAAGIKPGDVLVAVAEHDPKHIQPEAATDITHMETPQEVSRILEGKPGTRVRLTIRRGDKTLSFVVRRGEIRPTIVKAEMAAPGIGYLRISSFPSDVDVRVAAGLAELRQKGMRALILDMQENHGGFLDESVRVTDIFLADGIIASTQSRHKRDDRVYEARPGDPGEDLPILVLTDGETASAAEVVAGALQDHKRARLLGAKTYGKGAVNKRFALNDASGILLTTGRYLLPSGRQIDGEGLTPDIPVTLLSFEAKDKYRLAGKPVPNPARDAAVKLFQSKLGEKGSD